MPAQVISLHSLLLHQIEWTFNRDYNHFNAIDEDKLLKSNPEGCYLPNARNIFLPFAALDGKRTMIFQKSDTKKSTMKRSSIGKTEITARKVRNKYGTPPP